MTRFIFITGGVVSSLGKGMAAASLAVLLQERNYTVRLRKLDPYLNIDPGTMSPTQHGEVFVTDDGAETDLDLGHYERFTNVNAMKGDNITSGKLYANLLQKERRGDYLGCTVQVIPHVTDLIKEFIMDHSSETDFVMCEIGGTVGDIEALPYFEAIRQLGYQLGRDKTLFIHLTLVPYIASAKELKTKPTQHSVKELRSIGIQPDILLCRSDRIIPENDRRKIALFCNIPEESVIQGLDVETIYQIPLSYHNYSFDKQVLKRFNLPLYNDGSYEDNYNNNYHADNIASNCDDSQSDKIDLSKWQEIVNIVTNYKREINIAVIGKYTGLEDSYKSIIESLSHAGIANNVSVKIKWVDSRNYNLANITTSLRDIDGVLIPGGFGVDGSQGKQLAINYVRENNIPFFGICFGLQMAVIEFAVNVLKLSDASSSEFGECENSVIGLMTEWYDAAGNKEIRSNSSNLGGTMRLGAYECKIVEGTKLHNIYQSKSIFERHRHRYEVNINFKDALEKKGMIFSGLSPDGMLPEAIELQDHPWFIGVQFHPEFKSRPFAPHPLFNDFVAASLKHHNS
ncbi:MAG: CTP synthase [Pseudomonadota bacterium]